MKKDGKYRFTLQFAGDSEKQARAGELLEKLGNRKSVIIVDALDEYIASHPEILQTGQRIFVQVQPTVDRGRLEEMIHAIVEERLAAVRDAGGTEKVDTASVVSDEDIVQMLGNLELFGN